MSAHTPYFGDDDPMLPKMPSRPMTQIEKIALAIAVLIFLAILDVAVSR